jgi:hypothetical protein
MSDKPKKCQISGLCNDMGAPKNDTFYRGRILRFFAFAMPTESHNNGARRGYDHRGVLGQRAQVRPVFFKAKRI